MLVSIVKNTATITFSAKTMASSTHEALNMADIAPWATTTTGISQLSAKSEGNSQPSLILLQDSSTCSGDFVLTQFIKDKLGCQECVCLVGVAKDYEWYQSVLSKMGVQLDRHRKNGSLYYIDATVLIHSNWINPLNAKTEEQKNEDEERLPLLSKLSQDVLKYFRVWYQNGIPNCGSFNVVVDNLTLVSSLCMVENKTQIVDWIRFIRNLASASKGSSAQQSVDSLNSDYRASGCVLISCPTDLTPVYDSVEIDAGSGEPSSAKEVAPQGLTALVAPSQFSTSQFSTWLAQESLPDAILSVTPLATGYSKDFHGRLAVFVPSEFTRLINIPGVKADYVTRGSSGSTGFHNTLSTTMSPLGRSGSTTTTTNLQDAETLKAIKNKSMQVHGRGGYHQVFHLQVKDNGVMCYPR